MFKPINTQKITNNLYVIRTLFVNMYIYDTGKTLLVFDTGINEKSVKNGFKTLNLDYSRVSHIFLTHSDFDHVGGLDLFKNAKVYLSKEEEPLITGKKTRRAIIYNKRLTDYILMNDLEFINIGDITTVKIIFSPGHTIGSAMYLINNNILITGDTISITADGIVKNFSFVQNMNHHQNKVIVKKLKEDNFFSNKSIVATGHHGIIKK